MSGVACCTIVTRDYLPFAYALRDSLQSWQQVDLYVLVADGEGSPAAPDVDSPRGATRHLGWRALCAEGAGREIAEKYRATDMDAFRWAMKPLLLQHLLVHQGHASALFLDNDLYFVADFGFLLDELAGSSMLLTPHWRSSQPAVDPVNFQWLFLGGLFNAGFVGATAAGLPALDWWARACLHACRKDVAAGYFVDQRYLDAVPLLFDGVRIVRHRGCNVADWNRPECPRSVDSAGQVWIAERWPLVFVHCTRSLYSTVRAGGDACLAPVLEQQIEAVRRYAPAFDPAAREKPADRAPNEPGHGGPQARRGPGAARRFAGRVARFARSLRSRLSAGGAPPGGDERG